MEIAIAHRSAPELRCAYCHDRIGAAVEPCVGCGAVFHPDCRATLGGCPTLGCRRVAPALRIQPTLRRRGGGFDELGALFWAAIAWSIHLMGCVGLGGACAALYRGKPRFVSEGFVLAGVLVTLGLLALWLQARWERLSAEGRWARRGALLGCGLTVLCGLLTDIYDSSGAPVPAIDTVGLALGASVLGVSTGFLGIAALRRLTSELVGDLRRWRARTDPDAGGFPPSCLW